MGAINVITRIRQALLVVKQQGQGFVSVDALLNLLNTLESDALRNQGNMGKMPEAVPPSTQPDWEIQKLLFNANSAESLELLNSVGAYAQTALKSSILINGGAAVALLAFIGNIWGLPHGQGAIPDIANATTLFTYGVLVSAVATGTGYLTQLYFYKKNATARKLRIFSIILIIGSYIFFALGAKSAHNAFTERAPCPPCVSADKSPTAAKNPAQGREKPLAR